MSMSNRARRMAQHHLRHRADAELNLIPLIDILSTLVAFLLVYSTEVEVIQNSKGIEIPQSIAQQQPKDSVVVMITKGMQPQPEGLAALPDHVAAEVKRRIGITLPIAAIGGPCIAGELAVRRQTGVVITSRTPGLAQKLCDMLTTDYYHPRVSDDMEGVELCAAFKNFFGASRLPGFTYDFYDPPIPVKIEGSPFFDMTHATGSRPGPQSLKSRMPTIWEVHPLTSIKLG